jgi:molybdenum cofactor cytidylyltransferase
VKFGPLPLDEALGAIAAHSLRHPSGVIKKGTRLAPEHIERLRAAGLTEIVAARLEPGDCHEDQAARRVADAIRGDHVRVDPAFTGRSNLYAEQGGLLVVNRAAVDAAQSAGSGAHAGDIARIRGGRSGPNGRDGEGHSLRRPGAGGRGSAVPARNVVLSIAPWRGMKVGLAATTLPGLKTSVMDKTRRVLEERLRAAGSELMDEVRVPHEAGNLSEALARLRAAGAELLIAFGASAVIDEEDVIPSAIRQAGGRIRHFGMPVDPGNLLLIGDLGGAPVLGAPGCARSPAENGFDWVLQRLWLG